MFKKKTAVVPSSYVLIAEDEADIRQLLRLALERRGYAVTEAPDGTAALEAARAQPPAAMVLDIKLPGLNGFDLLVKMQQDPALATVPVVVLSGIDEKKERTEDDWAGRLQVARFIAKPADAEAVAEAIAAIAPLPGQGSGDQP